MPKAVTEVRGIFKTCGWGSYYAVVVLPQAEPGETTVLAEDDQNVRHRVFCDLLLPGGRRCLDPPQSLDCIEVSMLIDHIIYAAPDLDTAVAHVETCFGVRAGGGGKHLGKGTHNKLIALGPRTYLEIIAPDPDQPEPSHPRPYGVDGVTRGGLVGWALGCEDIDAALARARRHGFDPGEVIDGQRVGPTGAMLQWRLTRNALTAGLVPFLITWGDTPHPATSAPPGLVLESFHIEHPDPSTLTPVLAALDADVEVRPATDVALVARLNGPDGSKELR